jgi:hypothetical protein
LSSEDAKKASRTLEANGFVHFAPRRLKLLDLPGISQHDRSCTGAESTRAPGVTLHGISNLQCFQAFVCMSPAQFRLVAIIVPASRAVSCPDRCVCVFIIIVLTIMINFIIVIITIIIFIIIIISIKIIIIMIY